MSSAPRDVAQVRLDNAMRLFDEFVAATVKNADAATLRGLERRFADRLQIQPSYWSQIKSRSRQIGERLARQFEQLCHKPPGWMDLDHGSAPAQVEQDEIPLLPQDEDERFIVGLVLTYYRRHPLRARARLLDLLGEVLTPGETPPPPAAPPRATPSSAPAPAPKPAGMDEWAKLQKAVAPLKPRKR
ncbi:hypothetical protein ACG0Z6_11040 [Roseateles sp. BYS180W]|uniref:Uncharacterized protein n=1 Tax=Roseateles rivi TaxID=3299028 RepID=A0ABW7FWS1_9BURK